ncbi:hypothetical protein MCUN1_000517 [Malassezia cuniculi]|uniref:TLC domain-containing protein n=1 Tax=Malassezia cuniculi TaxID=948313 RepID=A0AAF0J5S1_9BASI|nr:hypothetical protein MCUN1_000517 [Malassezia cuniculi]
MWRYASELAQTSDAFNVQSLLTMGAMILSLSATYCGVSFFYRGDSKERRRQRSWIITTVSALSMTVLSLPLVIELVASGFDWSKVDHRMDTLSTPVCMLFAGYLFADLLMGMLFYRDQVQLSSGWVHHSVYLFCCFFWAHQRWSHGFAVAAVMELPTFVMGMGALFPPLRSHWAFTISFMTTRIVFHIGLIYSLINPAGSFVPDNSTQWGPVMSAALAFPMHVVWGYKCVRGLLRHRRRAAAARAAVAAESKVKTGPIHDIEAQNRARNLIDGAVRRLWSTAPEAWRRAYTEELARCREEGIRGKWPSRSLVARRALGRQLSRPFREGRDNVPHYREEVQHVTLGGGIVLRIPPELQVLRGQKFVVSEFPVEREALKSRRKRLVGAMRRRIEVARRDMVVF